MKTNRILSICGATVLLALGALLVSCSTGGVAPMSGFSYVADIPVPNVTAGTNFGFDISEIHGTNYYLTDRNNAALDIVDIPTQKLTAQVVGSGRATAFAGCHPTANCVGSNNGLSGPDGANAVGSLVYVGDVNSVKVCQPCHEVNRQQHHRRHDWVSFR